MLDTLGFLSSQSGMQKRSLRLAETDVPGHMTFLPPPKGFSPIQATDAELRNHGLPHWPDPKTFPREARLWRYAMSRIKTFVTPKLAIQPGLVHGPQNLPVFGPGVHDAKSSIWSGLVASAGLGYTQIWGTWTVPFVVPPGGSGGAYYSSLWIGLNDAHSLFQAGTERTLHSASAYFPTRKTGHISGMNGFLVLR